MMCYAMLLARLGTTGWSAVEREKEREGERESVFVCVCALICVRVQESVHSLCLYQQISFASLAPN